MLYELNLVDLNEELQTFRFLSLRAIQYISGSGINI